MVRRLASSGMSHSPLTAQVSRRTLLRTTAAAAVSAGGVSSARSAAASVAAPSRLAACAENVQVSADGYGLHAEPNIAANPLDPRNLLASSMVGPPGNPEFIATYASFDGGRSWRNNGALSLPAGTAFADDTTVAFSPHGTGFVNAMATSGLSRNDRGVYVWRTEDGGRSFAAPLAVMSGQFADHPWLAADRSRRGAPHSGNLYAVWVADDHAALGFTRSTDLGASFEAPRAIQGAAEHDVSTPMIAAGSEGVVAAIYEGPMDLSVLPDLAYTVEVVCSTDAGATFGPPAILGRESAAIALPGGVQPNSGPSIAIAPHDNAIYAAFTTHQPGAAHSDVAVVASFDAGVTWTAPVPITPTGDVVYFQPQLAVDQSGNLALTAFALAADRVGVVLLTSRPGRPRFGEPHTVTSAPFDPALGATGGKHGAWWIGDYQGLVIADGKAHPSWNDTRTGQLELFTADIPCR